MSFSQNGGPLEPEVKLKLSLAMQNDQNQTETYKTINAGKLYTKI